MEKQKKSNLLHQANGITLIALVISIIVMLILAGVSINAIVGENGILTRTQYATFLNEMAAVEEAVGIWKAGEAIEAGGQTTAIPTNGLCKANDLASAERLTGEVGYYRTWSINGNEPVKASILSIANIFNSAYEGEIVFYPAGVQDLYYLNNEACGIESKKTYLIDAATGMVYSMTGINLKGVSCYSSNMAKAVMNGTASVPDFAEAEVSGSSTGEKLAGNVQGEYLPDGTKNPNYNPNGFQIIADPSSSNIFKLYNNGDLYGKGVKGTQLNTSVAEMEKINPYVWKEWNVPEKIGEYKSIIVGCYDYIYIIDINDDLWLYGKSTIGLTEEQRIEYTGRDPVKIELNGRKVSRVFTGLSCTFVITTDNHLLAAGNNTNCQLGLGDNRDVITFEEVNVSNVENIEKIYCIESGSNANIIRYTDNTFFLAGFDDRDFLGLGKKTFKTFEKIFDGNNGPDIDQDIKELSWSISCNILKNNGEVWFCGYDEYIGGGLTSEKDGNLRKREITHVENFYMLNYSGILFEVNVNGEKKLYYTGTSKGLGLNNVSKDIIEIELPNSLKISEIYSFPNNVYFLSQTGEVYGSGSKSGLGLNENVGTTDGIIKLNIESVDTLYPDEVEIACHNEKSMVCAKKGDKLYCISTSTILLGDDILQQNWSLVAQNVKYFNGRGTCYVDRDNNLWVAGDSRACGLGEESREYKNIPNYVKCTDSSIAGKVEKCEMVNSKVLYVLLDNNELWATGLYKYENVRCYPGWVEEENKSTFFKIMNDVKFFSAGDISGENGWCKIAIKNSGEAYGWGKSWRGADGIAGITDNIIPTKYDLTEQIGGVNNISMLKCFGWQRSAIVTKTGKLFYTGSWTNGAYDGGHTATQTFSEYTHNLTLSDDESIISIAPRNDANAIMLTSKGRVFGYGDESQLGIGKVTTNKVETCLLTSLNNISQITVGNGFYIAVDKDGKVYGTGSNIYGILGRWKGAPRTSGRYRTAFEWVECPELEI